MLAEGGVEEAGVGLVLLGRGTDLAPHVVAGGREPHLLERDDVRAVPLDEGVEIAPVVKVLQAG